MTRITLSENSPELLHTVVFKLLFSSLFFHINHYIPLLLRQHTHLILPSWSLFWCIIIYFPLKYRTGWEKYNITAYSQGANQILICCSNSASVGLFIASKSQTNAPTSAGDSRRRSSRKPVLQLLFTSGCISALGWNGGSLKSFCNGKPCTVGVADTEVKSEVSRRNKICFCGSAALTIPPLRFCSPTFDHLTRDSVMAQD